MLTIKQLPFDGDFKIKFGSDSLIIEPVTAYGLMKTNPFADIDVFSVNKNPIVCDFKWDICVCKACPVFKRLIEFESNAVIRYPECRLENVIMFQQ